MQVTLVEVVGFAAFLTNVAGNFMLVYKNRWGLWGWVVRLISITLWFVYGIGDSSWPNTANAVVFFFINCWGIWTWRREQFKKEASA